MIILATWLLQLGDEEQDNQTKRSLREQVEHEWVREVSLSVAAKEHSDQTYHE